VIDWDELHASGLITVSVWQQHNVWVSFWGNLKTQLKLKNHWRKKSNAVMDNIPFKLVTP
jgi:hypothetical protein